MPRVWVASLTIAASGDLDAAIARDYPVCIKGYDFGAGYCGFDSYAQCQAAASDRDPWCTNKSRSATKPHLAAGQLQPKEALMRILAAAMEKEFGRKKR